MHRTLQVAQDTFEGDPIIFRRSFHSLREAIYRECNIWSGKGEILQSSNNMTIGSNRNRNKCWSNIAYHGVQQNQRERCHDV